MDRRKMLTGASAILAASAMASTIKAGAAAPRLRPAKLERGAPGTPFVPLGEFLTKATEQGYIEEEWIASGTDDKGLPYRTQIIVRRPRDPARFTGTVIVEPLHMDGIAPIYMYTSPYVLRSGHGWACIVSQRTALDQHLKGKEAQRYAGLTIGTDVDTTLPPRPLPGAPPAGLQAFLDKASRINQASNAILAQCGAALRAAMGPFGRVRNMVLVGHSQTGFVSTNFINGAHASHRMPGGRPVYDGFMPSGYPSQPFDPRDVPLIQVLSDGDVFDTHDRLLSPLNPGRHYRRDDSDAPNDRYRLYELAGVPHLGTSHPPFSDPKVSGPRQGGLIKPTDTMNGLPHNELFAMALDHLVGWSARGTTPPRAARIETAPDGRHFAKDEHGNSKGGVRCVQMDVPRATYFPVPMDANGKPAWATVGTETDFDVATMQRLYGTPDNYKQKFNKRLDELVAAGWMLADDAPRMRAEAEAQRW